jgi:Smg protein
VGRAVFDILVYLFENYFEVELQPDHGKLARELSAAGFDSKEITEAFDWFNDLEKLTDVSAYPTSLEQSKSVRCYAHPEELKVDTAGKGLLAFLEASGILSPVQRECVIDRVLALNEPEVSLEQLKWIVLMVLWSHGQDYVFMEDFLTGSGAGRLH